MIDYKLLEALLAVVEAQGFERAARLLGLSQSAVSQRIKLLEARAGGPVLERSAPPTPTLLGQQLLTHARQVQLLEQDLLKQVPALEGQDLPQRLRIAINADSLATWWAAAVAQFCVDSEVLLDMQVTDQDAGVRRMREGDVVACLCSAEKPLAGARSVLLGYMRYYAVATPDFIQAHFSQTQEPNWARVPAVVFGADDQLQARYLALRGHNQRFAFHLCPSSEGFVRLIENGMGWGMVPALQIQAELRAKRLAIIPNGPALDVPLYWHHWRNGGAGLQKLTAHLLRHSQALLQL